MQVVMRMPRRWLDAGEERQLDAGRVYDLPDVIAAAFIATGAAERPEQREFVVPETKPALVPERRERKSA